MHLVYIELNFTQHLVVIHIIDVLATKRSPKLPDYVSSPLNLRRSQAVRDHSNSVLGDMELEKLRDWESTSSEEVHGDVEGVGLPSFQL